MTVCSSLMPFWQQPLTVHLLMRVMPALLGLCFSIVSISSAQLPSLLPRSEQSLCDGSTPAPDAILATSSSIPGVLSANPTGVPPSEGCQDFGGDIQPPSHWVTIWHVAANTVSLQLEAKAGKGITERTLPDWKVALKREREEHQHLLAESYSAVMDLTKQLQISEKNWKQEKVELLARFKEEQQQAEQQAKDLQNKLNQVWCPHACVIQHRPLLAVHLLGDGCVLQLQKGANPWALKHSEMEKHGSNWKEVGERGLHVVWLPVGLRSVLKIRWRLGVPHNSIP